MTPIWCQLGPEHSLSQYSMWASVLECQPSRQQGRDPLAPFEMLLWDQGLLHPSAGSHPCEVAPLFLDVLGLTERS